MSDLNVLRAPAPVLSTMAKEVHRRRTFAIISHDSSLVAVSGKAYF